MTKAEEHRKRLSRQVEEQAGGKLTLTAFLVKAVAAVLGGSSLPERSSRGG